MKNNNETYHSFIYGKSVVGNIEGVGLYKSKRSICVAANQTDALVSKLIKKLIKTFLTLNIKENLQNLCSGWQLSGRRKCYLLGNRVWICLHYNRIGDVFVDGLRFWFNNHRRG